MRIFNTTIIIIIAFLIFVVFPLYRGAYASSDLAGMWYSAFIGSIITYFLLTMQSKGMVERERLAEVFKERLDIYQDFLKKLCGIVEDRTLTDAEWMNLQFQLSYLAIHTNRERMEIIQQNTFEILKIACLVEKSGNSHNDEVTSVTKDPVYMKCLYEIVRQMQAQLNEKNDMKSLEYGLLPKNLSNMFHYDEKLNKAWADWKEKTHKEFIGFNKVENKVKDKIQEINTFVEKSPEESVIKHTVDAKTLKEIRSIFLAGSNSSAPNEDKESTNKTQWKIDLEKEFSGWQFMFEPEGFQIRKSYGHVGIRYNAASGLYDIFANYWRDGVIQAEFSRPMKWDFGGTRSYGAWSVPLNSKRIGITTPIESSKLYTCLMSDAVKSILLEKMKLIVDHLDKHNRTVEWILALKNEGLDEEKWGVEAWYWDDMVCTALHDHPEFGKFRMGVKADEDNKEIELILENTEFDHDKLVKALNCIGLAEEIPNINEGTVVRKKPITFKDRADLTNQIAKRVKEITDLIEKGA